MATLGLAVAGSAIGGLFTTTATVGGGAFVAPTLITSSFATLGAAVGGGVGFAVDSVLMNTLNSQSSRLSTQIPEADLQGSSEGAPMTWIVGGNNVRVVPTVIWAREPIPVKVRVSNPGKGGIPTSGGGSSVTKYFQDTMLHCGLLPDGVTAQDVKRIFADGKLIYDQVDTTLDITADFAISKKIGIVTSSSFVETTNRPRPLRGNQSEITIMRVLLANSRDDETLDLTKRVRSGNNITISGMDNANNNGLFIVRATGKNGAGDTWFDCQNNNVVADASNASGRIVQAQGTFDVLTFTTLFFHDGSQTTPDIRMEAALGAGEVPVWPRQLLVRMDLFALEKFGRLPNFEVYLEVDSAPLWVGTAISRIMTRAGFESSEYDATAVTGDVIGYATSGKSAADMLGPLMLEHNLVEQEIDGKIFFFDRDDITPIVIDSGFNGAREEGGSSPLPFEMADADSFSIPRTVTVSYYDSENDGERGAESEHNRTGLGSLDLNLDLAQMSTSARARGVATRQMFEGIRHGQSVKGTLPPNFVYVRENDRLQVSGFGQTFDVLVSSLTTGANGIVEYSGVVIATSTFKELSGTALGPLSQSFAQPSPIRVVLIPGSGPLRQEDVGRTGFYWAVGMDDVSEPYIGSTVYLSTDDTNFVQIASNAPQAVMGDADMPFAAGPLAYWDELNTLRVHITTKGATLETLTEAEVLAGRNVALVDGEIIAFKTATLVDDDTYDLSGLLRGLASTEESVGVHATGSDEFERFVMLDADSLFFHDTDLGGIDDQAIYFKGVPPGKVEADVASQSDGLSWILNPAAPSSLAGTDEGSHLLFDWYLSSNQRFNIFQLRSRPPGDELDTTGKYTYEIYDGATLVRGPTTINDSFLAYTKTNQTTDGFSNGDTITFKVWANGVNGLSSGASVVEVEANN
jgi:hypothetical protein